MIKICAMSDLHGSLIKGDLCDLTLICGDIIPLEIQRSRRETYNWYKNTFKKWAESLPCSKVLFIAGNHECGMEGYEDDYYELFPDDSKVTFLFDDEYIYEKYHIYGTPWCKQFGKWAYMATNSQLEELYNKIPNNLDILMTHDAPYGVSDILLQEDCPWADGTHIGNIPLAKAIEKTTPKIVCHGHLHSTSRQFENLNKSRVINCSIKDEFYHITDLPREIYL